MQIKTLIKSIFLFSSLLLASRELTAQQDTTKKADFKPSGKVWGYAFGDYYYKMHADSAGRGSNQYSNMPSGATSFEFRRVYLGYDYNISERFSTEFLFAYEGTTLSDNATRTVFIKAANLRWKNIYKNADIIFGQQATPAFPMISEKIWGYRSIEKTILDMRKGASSNDLGIGIQAKIGDKGNYGYNVLVANGTAQKLETDIFKKFYGDFYAKFLDQKLVFDVYADYERTQMLPNFHKYKSNYKLDVMYTSDPVTVGVEAYMTTLHNYVGYSNLNVSPATHDTTDAKVMGVSVFVRGRIIKDKLNFFARYDMYNPDTKFNKDYTYTMGAAPVTESFITAGFDYTPHKNVHIMPNLWYDGYTSRAKGAPGKVKSDYDMVPRLTVWYVFK
ncbi:MAG TPA: hypothetical protein VFJ43_09250 [Bacteroidia bacterium]|nr:hypothetical protein [Bacteroidia bacterium]